MKVIKDLDELKNLCMGEGLEVRLLLAGGNVFSRKLIAYDGKMWYVMNYIDDTEQELTDKGLETESNIAEGLRKHALVYDEEEGDGK